MSKKYPVVGARQIGANYGSLADADVDTPHTLEDAEVIGREKGYIKTPHDLAEFRTGWYIGIANDAINDLRTWLRYLRRDEIETMGKELKVLADKYRAILDGEDEPQP